MLRIIEGPKQYVTNNVVVPKAFSADSELHAFHATEWLLECAENAVESGEATWDDFRWAEDFLSKFVPKFKDDKTGEVHQRILSEEDITTQGVIILEDAAMGEDVEDQFKQWSLEILDQIATSRRSRSTSK